MEGGGRGIVIIVELEDIKGVIVGNWFSTVVTIVEFTRVGINIISGTTMEAWDISMELTRSEINPNQNGIIKKEVLCLQKMP
jgi:hypothetical protein